MLKTRLLTGILLIGFIFWSIFSLPAEGFVLVAGILSVFMLHEWLVMINVKSQATRIIIIDIFIVVQIVCYWFVNQYSILLLLATIFWTLMIPALVWVQMRKSIPQINQNILIAVGAFAIFSMFIGLLQVRYTFMGDLSVLMIFVLLWLSDSLAYAVGRMIGRHKLAPVISPGKTWEGFIGATLLTVPLLLMYWLFAMENMTPGVLWYVAVTYMVVVALVGDLSESWVKRAFDKKDSGTLLPGHGGLLDRFDSLLAVAPVFAYFSMSGWL